MPSRNKGMRWTWATGCKCGTCRECKHRVASREYWHRKGKQKRAAQELEATPVAEPIKRYEWDRTSEQEDWR